MVKYHEGDLISFKYSDRRYIRNVVKVGVDGTPFVHLDGCVVRIEDTTRRRIKKEEKRFVNLLLCKEELILTLFALTTIGIFSVTSVYFVLSYVGIAHFLFGG